MNPGGSSSDGDSETSDLLDSLQTGAQLSAMAAMGGHSAPLSIRAALIRSPVPPAPPSLRYPPSSETPTPPTGPTLELTVASPSLPVLAAVHDSLMWRARNFPAAAGTTAAAAGRSGPLPPTGDCRLGPVLAPGESASAREPPAGAAAAAAERGTATAAEHHGASSSAAVAASAAAGISTATLEAALVGLRELKRMVTALGDAEEGVRELRGLVDAGVGVRGGPPGAEDTAFRILVQQAQVLRSGLDAAYVRLRGCTVSLSGL